MLNLLRFCKFSTGAKLQFGQSILANKKTSGYRFAHSDSSTSGRKSNVGKYAVGLGSLIIGFSSIVVYAKYDTTFRQWLKTNIYGSDELLKLLLFENNKPPNSVNPKSASPAKKPTINSTTLAPSKLESKEATSISEKSAKPTGN